MTPADSTKAAVTVTEMARMVGLSRARFYELLARGVFPAPARDAATQRPRFTRELQEQCLEVRRTHRGLNGETVLFYAVAPKSAVRPRRTTKSPRTAAKDHSETLPPGLRAGLAQLGCEGVSEAEVRKAVAVAWPAGTAGVDEATLLTTVFRVLQRRNSPDNVAT